ncbi:hypothetical protein ANCDUO_00990 [Ancylostoma duodenale]|uniref:Uncharacterized protein n=1 Tax=Ancylostoma duodenale TaxID=51022 RepID=A0A0C2E015_9BILA|nr:hypothetical protein ANCDUO_00990 [Ancylostoma duodenale]
MIYSQAFRNEQFSPAVALFSAAGLIRTTAGIHDQERSKKLSTSQRLFGLYSSVGPCRDTEALVPNMCIKILTMIRWETNSGSVESPVHAIISNYGACARS